MRNSTSWFSAAPNNSGLTGEIAESLAAHAVAPGSGCRDLKTTLRIRQHGEESIAGGINQVNGDGGQGLTSLLVQGDAPDLHLLRRGGQWQPRDERNSDPTTLHAAHDRGSALERVGSASEHASNGESGQ